MLNPPLNAIKSVTNVSIRLFKMPITGRMLFHNHKCHPAALPKSKRHSVVAIRRGWVNPHPWLFRLPLVNGGLHEPTVGQACGKSHDIGRVCAIKEEAARQKPSIDHTLHRSFSRGEPRCADQLKPEMLNEWLMEPISSDGPVTSSPIRRSRIRPPICRSMGEDLVVRLVLG